MNTCDMCGHADAHDPMCPNRTATSRVIAIIDPGMEFHPAGTRAKIEAQAAELAALRDRCEALETVAKYHLAANMMSQMYDDVAARALALEAEHAALNTAYTEVMTVVGNLYAMIARLRDLVVSGAADDRPEAIEARSIEALADELIGVVPVGDVSGADYPCPLCNGKGEYANVSPCNACGGAGVVDAPEQPTVEQILHGAPRAEMGK